MRIAVIFLVLAAASLVAQKSVPGDPWPSKALMEPADLAALIEAHNKPLPSILYVGFPNLYRGAHIRGAVLDGPASKPEGLDELRQVTKNMPSDHAIVIYCGCCPFDKCPNIRPAYQYLKDKKFTNVRVLNIPTNLHTDWVSKGYLISRGPFPVAAADAPKAKPPQ